MLLHALTVARLPRQAGSSRIRFRPVAAHLTPIAMADMIARYRLALDRHLADPLASSQGWHEAAHDIAPWLDYFWGALLRAYKEFEERVGTIERGRGAKGDRVRSEILKRQLLQSATCPVICSYQFAKAKADDIKAVEWDLVVLDETHRLRNVYKASNVIAKTLKDALAHVHSKVLLRLRPSAMISSTNWKKSYNNR